MRCRSVRPTVCFVSILFLGCVFALSARSPVGAAPRPNERFYNVAQHLDRGGTFYLYVDLRDVLRRGVGELAKAVSEPDSPQDVLSKLEAVERVIDTLGLYGIHDLGASSFPESNGRHLGKAFLSVPENRKGLTMAFSRPHHAFGGLAMAPEDTIHFVSYDVDGQAILALARQVANDAGGAEMAQKLDAQITATSTKAGVDLASLVQSVSGEIWTLVRLDAERLLPVGTRSVAEPQAAIGVDVVSPLLFETVVAQLTKNQAAGPERVVSGMQIVPVVLPPGENAWKVDPVVAFDGQRFYAATHASLLDRMIVVREGAPGLATNPEFLALSEGLPTQGNGMGFGSARLTAFIQQLTYASASGAPAGPEQAFMSVVMNRLSGGNVGSYGIIQGLPDGIYSVTRSGLSGHDQVLALALVPVGVMAATAVPGFIHARGQAQGKACLEAQDKLEGAVDQWAIETGAAPGAKGPSWSVLVGPTGYLRRTPICPVDGTPIAIPNVGGTTECPNHIPSHARP